MSHMVKTFYSDWDPGYILREILYTTKISNSYGEEDFGKADWLHSRPAKGRQRMLLVIKVVPIEKDEGDDE